MKLPPAIVFAAGLGTRMKQLMQDIPKPMLEIEKNIRLVDYSIKFLSDNGIEKIYINIHHHTEILYDYIEQNLKRKFPHIEFHVLFEKILLETGGTVKKLFQNIEEDWVFAINSDNFFQNYSSENLATSYNLVTKKNMYGSLFVKDIEEIQYDIRCDFKLEDYHLSRDEPRNMVFIGVQLLHKNLFQNVGDNIFSLSQIYFNNLPKLLGISFTSTWYPVGTEEEYYRIKNFLHTNI